MSGLRLDLVSCRDFDWKTVMNKFLLPFNHRFSWT